MTRTDRVHTNDTHSPSCTSNDVVQNVRLHTLLLTNEEATLQSDCPGIRILMMHDKAILSSETHSNDARQSYCLAKHTPTMCYKVIVSKTYSGDALQSDCPAKDTPTMHYQQTHNTDS